MVFLKYENTSNIQKSSLCAHLPPSFGILPNVLRLTFCHTASYFFKKRKNANSGKAPSIPFRDSLVFLAPDPEVTTISNWMLAFRVLKTLLTSLMWIHVFACFQVLSYWCHTVCTFSIIKKCGKSCAIFPIQVQQKFFDYFPRSATAGSKSKYSLSVRLYQIALQFGNCTKLPFTNLPSGGSSPIALYLHWCWHC